jgi:hypothetical protein
MPWSVRLASGPQTMVPSVDSCAHLPNQVPCRSAARGMEVLVSDEYPRSLSCLGSVAFKYVERGEKGAHLGRVLGLCDVVVALLVAGEVEELVALATEAAGPVELGELGLEPIPATRTRVE